MTTIHNMPPLPKYIDLLPNVYRRSGDYNHPLIEDYLKIFEKILTGEETKPEANTLYRRKGLGQTLNVIPGIFYPRFSFLFEPGDDKFIPPILGTDQEAHETELNSYVGASYAEYSDLPDSEWQLEFNLWINELLDWMSSRVDLTLNPDWDVDTKRYLVAYFMPFFRQRGTSENLQTLLQIFMGNGNPHTPLEDDPLIQNIQVHSIAQTYKPTETETVGTPIQNYIIGQNITLADTYQEGMPLLDGQRPYTYLTQIIFKESQKNLVDQATCKFESIFNEEKPALGNASVVHTVPFMLGPDSASALGINTYLTPSP